MGTSSRIQINRFQFLIEIFLLFCFAQDRLRVIYPNYLCCVFFPKNLTMGIPIYHIVNTFFTRTDLASCFSLVLTVMINIDFSLILPVLALVYIICIQDDQIFHCSIHCCTVQGSKVYKALYHVIIQTYLL